MRKARNLHSEVESDLCPRRLMLWLVRRQELLAQGSIRSIYCVYPISGHQMNNQVQPLSYFESQ